MPVTDRLDSQCSLGTQSDKSICGLCFFWRVWRRHWFLTWAHDAVSQNTDALDPNAHMRHHGLMITTNGIQEAHSAFADPVTRRYQPRDGQSDMERQNLDRIRVLMKLFGLTVSQISKAGGCSRPYLSRALSGSLIPSPKFYRVLEGNLGRLVDGRNSQFFAIPATDCDERVRELVTGSTPAH